MISLVSLVNYLVEDEYEFALNMNMNMCIINEEPKMYVSRDSDSGLSFV